MASIKLVTTKYSQFAVDFNHINIVVVHTYHKHFTNLGSYSHFYIHVIHLFIHYLFYILILSPMFRHAYRDWLISYLASHLVLPSCIYYSVDNTYRLSLKKKNGLPVRNIGFTKYFFTSICCVVILNCSFLILSIGYIVSQRDPAPFFGKLSVTTLSIFLLMQCFMQHLEKK